MLSVASLSYAQACICSTYMVLVGLLQQVLEEAVRVTDLIVVNGLSVCDEAIAPVQPHPVLSSTCMKSSREHDHNTIMLYSPG